MKSDKLGDDEKGEIKKSRYKPLTGAISSGDAGNIRKAVGDLSKGELEALPATMFVDTPQNRMLLENLTDKQRDTITDSKERTTAERDFVRKMSPTGSIETAYTTAGGGVAGAAAVTAHPNFARLTPPQIAKLKKEILLQPAVITELTPAALAKLADENKFSAAEMQAVGRQIAANVNARGHSYVTGPAGILWQ